MRVVDCISQGNRRTSSRRTTLQQGCGCAYSGRFIELAWLLSTIGQGGKITIKKVKNGYKVLSEKGKNLGGPYKTKEKAEKRLKQVEYFKHRKG
jgi:hypothetical protein